jgi:hypothetical protein
MPLSVAQSAHLFLVRQTVKACERIVNQLAGRLPELQVAVTIEEEDGDHVTVAITIWDSLIRESYAVGVPLGFARENTARLVRDLIKERRRKAGAPFQSLLLPPPWELV